MSDQVLKRGTVVKRDTNHPTLCVFTPTYNRAYILSQLYQSLLRQTSNDFYWLVCDDGSQDDTEKLIRSFIDEGRIRIEYFKVENGGKPRALNYGVSRCTSELFCCVDSDDYLVDSAVEQLLKQWRKVRDDQSIAGIIALRGTDENTPLGTWIPDGLERVKMWDLFETHKFKGDQTLVHRTSILRQYPYDVADGEKFIAETSVYYRLDDQYDMATLNRVLTICYYLEDGYTANFVRNAKSNPIGYYRHKRYCASRARTMKLKIKETILYLVGCMLAGRSGSLRDAPDAPLAALCYAPALLVRYTIFR